MAHYYALNLTAAHILIKIENLLFTNLATRVTYLKHYKFTYQITSTFNAITTAIFNGKDVIAIRAQIVVILG